MSEDKKYSRGSALGPELKNKRDVIKSKLRRKKLIQKDKKIEEGLKKAAKAEILLSEEPGYCIFILVKVY